MMNQELPVVAFSTQNDLEQYFYKHHALSRGMWIRFYKKSSSIQSVNYDEALDVALCYGWIDGQLKKYDDTSYLQKFTPRRPKSIWSKRNRTNVIRLIKEGKMREAGLKEVDAAKKDGRWDVAYDSQKTMTIPDDFLKMLSKNKEAYAFFQTLNKTNLYTIVWRLQTAKTLETKERRMRAMIEMLSNGKKFH